MRIFLKYALSSLPLKPIGFPMGFFKLNFLTLQITKNFFNLRLKSFERCKFVPLKNNYY